jgi:predicted RNA-binding Zn ribbon-like protein
VNDESAPVEALRFDAGSLSLNLVATLGRRHGEPVERLTSAGRLDEWLRGHGLDVRATGDALESARALREQLHRLFSAALAGHVEPADVDGLSAGALRLRRTHSGLALDGGFEAVVALIAGDAMRILTTNELADLRMCDAVDCRMLYLARGRRPRRWCSSQRCGNRSRVAAHRARERSRK